MARGAHHGRTGGLTPRKTAFDMSFEHKGTCELGRLIPVMVEEVYSGEFWDLGVQHLIRFHPQVAPLMHEVNVTFHDFFVPFRLLWEDWDEFITGGAQGTEADDKGLTWPTVNLTPTAVTPTIQYLQQNPGTLWDYIYGNISHYTFTDLNSEDQPIDAPVRAFWLIWNDYYRDENLEPRKGEGTVSNARYDPDFLYAPRIEYWQPPMRSWVKDYFTSALPFQQRGIAPAFPITLDNAPIVWDNLAQQAYPNGTPMTQSDSNGALRISNSTNAQIITAVGTFPSSSLRISGDGLWHRDNPNDWTLFTSPGRVSNSAVLNSFDVNYLRYAVQIQKILERNARGGVRYNEWLYGHFGDRPRDERLQRPEYIGGHRSDINISEVLQTSATDGGSPSGPTTPQGTMAGHMISAQGGRTGKYRVHEHGLIMRIMSVMPTPSYEDGIERMWYRRNRYDYLMPELVNLSEQAILNKEIFATGGTADEGIWGYQPQYDELRIRRNRVSGELRVNVPSGVPSLGYWHLGRAFDALPTLGKEFINYDGPTLTNRIMAVADVHPVIFSVGNISRAVRPLPYIGEPGLVDHH